MVSAAGLQDRVGAQMPRLIEELEELMAIPSASAPGCPEVTHGPLRAAGDVVVGLFRAAGCEPRESVELPGTAPVVFGEIPAPAGEGRR